MFDALLLASLVAALAMLLAAAVAARIFGLVAREPRALPGARTRRVGVVHHGAPVRRAAVVL
jgi:hypothetical protein